MPLFDKQSLFPIKPQASVYSMLRFPIQSASILLKRGNCHSLLETLRLIVPESFYRQHYYPAIECFTNYVQVLPARREGAFSEIQGLLEYSLARATYILTIGLSHLYPHQKNFHQLQYTPFRAAELYAAFTTALFRDVHLLICDYEIVLYDNDEREIKIWRPYEGALTEKAEGGFFGFRFVQNSTQLPLNNACLTSVILSSHLATQQSFFMIARYPDLLEVWLYALSGQTEHIPPHMLLSLLPIADRQAIDQRLQKSVHPDSKFYRKNGHEKLIDHFIKWLQDKKASDQLAVNANEAIGVRRVKEGLLVSEREAMEFARTRKVSIETLYQAIKNASRLRGVNEVHHSSKLVHTSDPKWLLMHNPSLVFSVGQLPALFSSRDTVSHIRPTQLMNPAKI